MIMKSCQLESVQVRKLPISRRHEMIRKTQQKNRVSMIFSEACESEVKPNGRRKMWLNQRTR